MTLNRLLLGRRETVVHQPVASPECPKWCGFNLSCCVLEFVRWQKRYSIAQSVGNDELAAVDYRARAGRRDGGNVTNRTAYCVKVLFTGDDVIRDWPA